MKTKWKAVFLAVLIVSQIMVISVPAYAQDTEYTFNSNKQGTQDDYDYELWKNYGNTQMTLNGNGCFSCLWSSIGNAFFQMGKRFDCTKKYQQIGNISVEYGVHYDPKGNSYLGIHGWSKKPLVEFYIVNSWDGPRPPVANSKGQITVDGGTYDVYVTEKMNQPSIEGNTEFKQFWSVRTSKKTSGTISVSEHFKKWEQMGLKLGSLYEVCLCVEGYQSSGQAEVYKNDFKINGSSISTSGTASTLSEGKLWIVGGVIAAGAVGATGALFAVKKKKASKKLPR